MKFIDYELKLICKNSPLCLGAEAAVLLLLLFVDDVVHGPQSQKRDAPSPSPTLQANANVKFKQNLLIMTGSNFINCQY